MGRGVGRLHRCRVADIEREGGCALAGAVEMGDEAAAEILQQPDIHRIGLAEAGDDDAAQWQVGWADDRDQLVLLAVEPGCGGNRPADRAAGRLVEPPRRGGQRPPLPRADDDGARTRHGEFGETDLHGAPQGKRSSVSRRDRRAAAASQCRRAPIAQQRRSAARGGLKAMAMRYPHPYDPPR